MDKQDKREAMEPGDLYDVYDTRAVSKRYN